MSNNTNLIIKSSGAPSPKGPKDPNDPALGPKCNNNNNNNNNKKNNNNNINGMWAPKPYQTLNPKPLNHIWVLGPLGLANKDMFSQRAEGDPNIKWEKRVLLG